MNTAALPATGDAAAAVIAAAPADAVPIDPALAAATPAFLQFMQLDAAAPAPQAAVPPPLEAPELEQDAAAPVEETASPDTIQANAGQPLEAAMLMPLMPSMMAQPAALTAVLRLAGGLQEADRPVARALPTAAAARATAPAEAVPANLAQASLQVEAAAPSAQDSVAAQPARAGAQSVPAQAAIESNARAAAPQTGDAAAAPDAQPAPAPGAGFGVAPNTPAATVRETTTLTLSGPPAAWRQSLQDALGERLQLQGGKGFEQAVIRLEPPMLGRVEIAIRHAAGSLEVNISATHGEVLRQLNTVSENLRNDLAGRQYADVSVTVSQAPRAQAAAQSGAGFGAGTDQQGRRQQEQDQARPGAALLDAHQPNTAFSLSGRT